MKFSREELERKAAEALRSCLEGVPSVRIESVEKDRDFNGNRADLVTTVTTPAGTRYLVAEVKTVGQPRVAREAINRLWRCRENAPDVVPVFIAPYISPRAGEICTQDGIGYADLAGNCRIFMDTIFIEREGKPNPFSEKTRSSIALFPEIDADLTGPSCESRYFLESSGPGGGGGGQRRTGGEREEGIGGSGMGPENG